VSNIQGKGELFFHSVVLSSIIFVFVCLLVALITQPGDKVEYTIVKQETSRGTCYAVDDGNYVWYKTDCFSYEKAQSMKEKLEGYDTLKNGVWEKVE
jgi:hypothetical protein